MSPWASLILFPPYSVAFYLGLTYYESPSILGFFIVNLFLRDLEAARMSNLYLIMKEDGNPLVAKTLCLDGFLLYTALYGYF
jgi:hypothetical protein